MEQHPIWQEFILQAQTIKTKLQATLAQIASTHQLTVHQLLVLIGIQNCQVMTVGDVTKELMILQANASALCKRMEEQGYVRRIRNEQDERVVNVVLDHKGHAILQEVVADISERYHKHVLTSIDISLIYRGFQEWNRMIALLEGEQHE